MRKSPIRSDNFMKLAVYNQKGDKVDDHDINDAVFAVDVNEQLVHQVIVAQEANARQTLAHTKQRGEVRGGGKKPWRQKGTGRARHGSNRSPLWRGGAVTFGPTNQRNFSKRINKKMKRKALMMVLSDKVAHDNLVLLDSLSFEKPATKELMNSISSLPVSKHCDSKKRIKTLIVMPETDSNVILSGRNVREIKVIRADSLNVRDVVLYDRLVIPVKSLDIIEKTYL